jgi:tRNA1Val (adenine37-N6)-methyltransferase
VIDAEAARAYFPRGLSQPGRGYRFSADSLLLACFAQPATGRVLDLGCGCGVVGLGMLLAGEGPEVTGLDSDPDMAERAAENAGRLGLSERYTAMCADAAGIRQEPRVRPESFEAAVCNPPYRRPGSGREPAEGGGRSARFEGRGSIGDFVGAAAYALRNKGRLFLVFLPERLAELFAVLGEAGLEPKRLGFVHSRPGEPAKTVLVEARKNGGPGLAVEPPLTLYSGNALSKEALEYCPYLDCNPGEG